MNDMILKIVITIVVIFIASSMVASVFTVSSVCQSNTPEGFFVEGFNTYGSVLDIVKFNTNGVICYYGNGKHSFSGEYRSLTEKYYFENGKWIKGKGS